MAKSRIQGISIVLDGQTQGLQKALQDVNKRSIELQGELRDVEKLLKFNPDSVEALAQKQKILTDQIANTTEKLDRLRKAQDQVEQQFKSGDIGEKQYRAFRREIEYTEQQLRNLDNKLSQLDVNQVKEARTQFDKLGDSIDNANKEAGSLGDTLGGLVAGAAAGVGIKEVIEKSLDTSSLNTQIDISLNLDDEGKQVAKDLIKDLEAYGLDGAEALSAIQKQFNLNDEASAGSNASIIRRASALQKAYNNLDLTEITQETYEISKIFGIGQQEAIGLVQAMADIGFDVNQLDIIAEYGTQFERLGFSAEESASIIAAGTKLGVQNIDQLADAVKEGRIVMAEFGYEIDDATSILLSQVGISTEQFKVWGKNVAKGGIEGSTAMKEVAAALLSVEDSTLRNQLGTTIFGSLYEEVGDNVANTILGMSDNMIKIDEGLQRNNENLGKLDEDPIVKLKDAMNNLMVALEPLMLGIADFVGKLAEWVSANPKLAAAIAAIVSVLGILAGIFAVIAPIVTTLTTLWPLLAAGIGAISAPVLGVVAVIAGLIAIGVALWKNWDVIKAKAIEIWESIKEFFSQTWENIKTKSAEIWENVKTSIINVWENIKSFFTETVPQIVNNIINWFNELPNKIAFALGTLLGHIIKWGLDTWNYFTTNVPIWIESVANWFGELPGKIWNWLVGVYNKVVDWGKNIWNYFKTNVPVWINNVVSFFSELPGKIWTWLSNTISKVVSFGSELKNKAVQAGSNFVSGLIDKVTSLPEKMVGIGKNIISGLWNGISGMWDWLWGRVRGFFDNFIGGVMNVLDEHSPSRVFEGIGEFVGEGFAIGIDNTRKMVSKAGQNMANASIPKMPKVNSAINDINNQPTIVYLTTENYMDSKLIGSHTTKNVINNMNRSTRNYRMGKGGLGGYAIST